MATHWSASLKRLNACSAAVTFAEQHETLESAWKACQRGDWMLWLLGKLSGAPGSEARKPLVLAACACARLALKHVPSGEERPLKAIETAERWAHGEEGVTLEDVRKASDAAYAYAATAYADAACACATAACAATAYAACACATAAYAATAYADADADAACAEVLARCAEIVRERYPEPPVLPKGKE